MDRERAIRIISCLGWGYPENEIKEAVAMATEALKKCEKYEAAQTPVEVCADRVWNMFKCPNCGEIHGDDEHDIETLRFCPNCGRPLKWRKKNNAKL